MPTRPTLVDTHAHLVEKVLLDRIDEVFSAAAEAGVRQIVAVGTTAEDSAACVELAQARAGVFAAVGIQPNHVAEAGEGDWGSIVDLSKRERVVAIGETGLDRYWDRTPFEQQQTYFGEHIALADSLGLALIIHCRDCEGDIVEQLAALGRPVRGVLHSFTGRGEDAEAFLALGLHISFAGMITFTKKDLDALREVARIIPEDRLLIETDSPYLSPHPLRGRFPNEPARVVHTAATIAGVRGCTLGELGELTTRNARWLFGLDTGDVLPC